MRAHECAKRRWLTLALLLFVLGFIPAQQAAAQTALPVISITAEMSPVNEGVAAIFTVTATPQQAGSLNVMVSLSQNGLFIDGESGIRTVTIPDGSPTAPLTVPTADDADFETNGSITATLVAGEGYIIGTAATATTDVLDNDSAGSAPDPVLNLTGSIRGFGRNRIVRLTWKPPAAASSWGVTEYQVERCMGAT